MYIGEFIHNLDDKGRLSFPATFKAQLGNEVVLVRGLEACIYVFDLNTWNAILTAINDLTFTKKSNRQFQRLFLSGAHAQVLDSKGRVNLPASLINHAGLAKSCIILGAGDRLEIWDAESWQTYYTDNNEAIETISEELEL